MERILCGVDLGGTKLSVGLVTESGRVLQIETRYDHVGMTPDGIVDAVTTTIGELCATQGLKPSALAGVGVGSAGHIRFRDGVMITMSNLKGFAGYPLRDKLQSRVPAPVTLDNDANAQAFAEYKLGQGRGLDPFLFLTVSTQIGAGIVLGGQLFRGQTGTAGEFGHTIVHPFSDQVCPCGNKGCLIAHASGVAISQAYVRHRAALGSPWGDSHPEAAAHPDGPFIAQGLAAGDAACQAVVDEFASYLGVGLYNLFQTFNPQAIVIGGGLSHWGPALFEPTQARFRSLAGAMLFDELRILPGTVEDSGVVGAALLGLP